MLISDSQIAPMIAVLVEPCDLRFIPSSNCADVQPSGLLLSFTVKLDEYTVAGDPKIYLDKGDSGKTVTRRFCETCGSYISFMCGRALLMTYSHIFSTAAAAPGIAFVRAGTIFS
jgi:hypothetical protein